MFQTTDQPVIYCGIMAVASQDIHDIQDTEISAKSAETCSPDRTTSGDGDADQDWQTA